MTKPPTTPSKAPAPPSGVGLLKPKPQGKAVCIYGPGGIGKTSLVALLDSVVWFDMDESLSDLGLMDATCAPCDTYEQIMDALKSNLLDNSKVIVFDSGTKLEEISKAFVIRTIPHEKPGYKISRIEDYGYGKGYGHIFDAYMDVLLELQRHRREGRHVVFICHDCTNKTPNPQGEDWIRYEPRLQSPDSGKNSIRLRLREWVSELYCIAYDVNVKDGRAEGSGTRTIYPVEMPHCMAKSRTFSLPFVYTEGDDTVWRELGMKG